MSNQNPVRIDFGEDIRASALAVAFLAIVLGVTQCCKCAHEYGPSFKDKQATAPAAPETTTP